MSRHDYFWIWTVLFFNLSLSLSLSLCLSLSLSLSLSHNIQLFNVWEVNRPEYFPRDAGNSSMRSIARGQRQRHRAVPSTEGVMFCSIDWSNIKLLFYYLISIKTLFLFSHYIKQFQTNAFLKKWKDKFLDSYFLDEQSMLIIQFWCKDGHYKWQVQGNVSEIYVQSLC